MATKLACVVLVLCMVLGAQVGEAAITCGQAMSKIVPCFSYLRGASPLTQTCCNGVKTLNAAASTTPDRKAACQCLKAAAGTISGLNYGIAAGLPGKCGVSIPYKISPSTNCDSIK